MNDLPVITAGLAVENYPYFDKSSNGLDFDAMLGAVREIPAGDVLLLDVSGEEGRSRLP